MCFESIEVLKFDDSYSRSYGPNTAASKHFGYLLSWLALICFRFYSFFVTKMLFIWFRHGYSCNFQLCQNVYALTFNSELRQ